MSRVPVMLTVAGSDPSGGAGIQADLKTATALGVYGAAVITSLTAQNTTGVSGIFGVPADFVADQYESVVSDLDVRAMKIGMLGDADVAVALADAMRRRPVAQVVLDPVLMATSGDRLVPDDAVEAIREHLLPLATLVTPNLPEAGVLAALPEPGDRAAMVECGQAIRERGAGAVLVKGGHLTASSSDDVFVDAGGTADFTAPRVRTANTHGTGCTLSAAIASRLLDDPPLTQAVQDAKSYVTGALRSGAELSFGAGSGPVDHLWEHR